MFKFLKGTAQVKHMFNQHPDSVVALHVGAQWKIKKEILIVILTLGQDFIEIFINKDMVVFNYLRNKLVVEISQRCKVLGLVQEINLAHFPVTNIYSTEREKGEGKAIFFRNGNIRH